jgi:flagellar hook-length control protein FliK
MMALPILSGTTATADTLFAAPTEEEIVSCEADSDAAHESAAPDAFALLLAAALPAPTPVNQSPAAPQPEQSGALRTVQEFGVDHSYQVAREPSAARAWGVALPAMTPPGTPEETKPPGSPRSVFIGADNEFDEAATFGVPASAGLSSGEERSPTEACTPNIGDPNNASQNEVRPELLVARAADNVTEATTAGRAEKSNSKLTAKEAALAAKPDIRLGAAQSVDESQAAIEPPPATPAPPAETQTRSHALWATTAPQEEAARPTAVIESKGRSGRELPPISAGVPARGHANQPAAADAADTAIKTPVKSELSRPLRAEVPVSSAALPERFTRPEFVSPRDAAAAAPPAALTQAGNNPVVAAAAWRPFAAQPQTGGLRRMALKSAEGETPSDVAPPVIEVAAPAGEAASQPIKLLPVETRREGFPDAAVPTALVAGSESAWRERVSLKPALRQAARVTAELLKPVAAHETHAAMPVSVPALTSAGDAPLTVPLPEGQTASALTQAPPDSQATSEPPAPPGTEIAPAPAASRIDKGAAVQAAPAISHAAADIAAAPPLADVSRDFVAANLERAADSPALNDAPRQTGGGERVKAATPDNVLSPGAAPRDAVESPPPDPVALPKPSRLAASAREGGETLSPETATASSARSGAAEARKPRATEVAGEASAPPVTAAPVAASHSAQAASDRAGVRAAPQTVVSQTARQLVDLAEGDTRREARSLRFDLQPEHLGPVEIELTRDGEGGLHARLTAERGEAHRALADGLGQLRESLERAGLTVERLEVSARADVSAQGGGPHHRQHDQRPPSASPPFNGPGTRPDNGPAHSEDDGAARAAAEDRIISLRA